MVPVRVISEELGANVKWDNSTKSFTITSSDGKTVIVGKAKSSQVTVNGKSAYIDPSSPDVVVEQKKGRVFVPIRFVSESFGAEVNYVDRIVYIQY